MQLTVEPKDVSDAYSTPIVQQTSFWSRVKANLGMRSKAFEFSVRNSDLYTDVGGWSRTNADLLMFAQYCSSDEYVAYLPYGPEIEPSEENQGRFLEELSECLRSYLPKGCLAIRYDLNWQSHWCKEGDFDAEGNWRGCPRKEFQEMHMNYGTATWNLFKANMNVLPSDTIVVDLCGTEEQILASMKPKTRYNIGLARRKGVEVREMGPEALGLWYDLYSQTAHRNGLHVNDRRYFESVIASRMQCSDPEVSVKLLMAFHEEKPLAAMFLILSAHRATYLYGASATKGRHLMPTYALQWCAMQTARRAGCSEYDLFGVAPNADPLHPMHGLYRFKTGLGGQMYHQMGCWDYPLDMDGYRQFVAREMSMPGYYA